MPKARRWFTFQLPPLLLLLLMPARLDAESTPRPPRPPRSTSLGARLAACAEAARTTIGRLASEFKKAPIDGVLVPPVEQYGGGEELPFVDLFHSPAGGWRSTDQLALRSHVQGQLDAAKGKPRSVVFYPRHSADPVHSARVPWTGAGLLPVAPRWMHPRVRRALERRRDYPLLLQGALLLSLVPYNLNATRASVELGDACVRSSWLIDRALRHPLDTLRVSRQAILTYFKSARANFLLDGLLGQARGTVSADTDECIREPDSREGEKQDFERQEGTLGLHATRTISAPRVCCTASWRTRGSSTESSDGFVTLAFRGTKQLSDLFTDLDALPERFGTAAGIHSESVTGTVTGTVTGPLSGKDIGLPEGRGGRCHRGFNRAYASVASQIEHVLKEALPNGGRVLLTGHSLGGALAQLAAVAIARTSDEGRPMRPLLITFAAPAIGDVAFAAELSAAAEPCGGLRVYNRDDPIPALSTLVGYKHAGVPVVLDLSQEAISAYARVAAPGSAFGAVAPHVLYHVGTTVYAVWTPRPLDSPPDPEPELDNQAQMMGRTLDARRVDIANAFSNKPLDIAALAAGLFGAPRPSQGSTRKPRPPTAATQPGPRIGPKAAQEPRRPKPAIRPGQWAPAQRKTARAPAAGPTALRRRTSARVNAPAARIVKPKR